MRTNEELLHGHARRSSLGSKNSGDDEQDVKDHLKLNRALLADEDLPKCHPSNLINQVRKAALAYNARPVAYRDQQL